MVYSFYFQRRHTPLVFYFYPFELKLTNAKESAILMRMEQLAIFSESSIACVFTGHRSLGENFSVRNLKKEIKTLLLDGVRIFYNGMAVGFDMLAAETLLSFKRAYPDIKLVACIPCLEQDKFFSASDKKRYKKLLKKADEQILLSNEYHRGCMQNRNRYMVERADIMIAHCIKTEGGTAYTVNYFKRKKPNGKIIFV